MGGSLNRLDQALGRMLYRVIDLWIDTDRR